MALDKGSTQRSFVAGHWEWDSVLCLPLLRFSFGFGTSCTSRHLVKDEVCRIVGSIN